ncbi:replication initiation protein [Chryseobacterium sp. PS-8]|uniref:Replication initiation protein n=1 Tax=Chryseobacterium indicum TaxID=2766954 RepID=A0ABS9C972_9FLAO|nr:replication initiation protein [Chryseobacterium sp. PS-8]
MRFYELLKSYEGIGRRVFEVQELKEILCVEDKYAKYANFKKRILLKAQEDIGKHTDIRFTFEEISETSRSVEKLIFNIYTNKKVVIENDDEEYLPKSDNPSETVSWYDEIKAFGVSKATIESQII